MAIRYAKNTNGCTISARILPFGRMHTVAYLFGPLSDVDGQAVLGSSFSEIQIQIRYCNLTSMEKQLCSLILLLLAF